MPATHPLNTCRRLSAFALALAVAGLASTAAANTVVFSDDFEDGSVADWVKSSNFAGTTAIVASAVRHAGAFGLETYLEVPPLSGNNLFVRATHDFTAPVTADYSLDLWARSTGCSGCVISYDILIDGVSKARTFAASAFEPRSFTLTGLTAGPHTITLGMFTTTASSGHFFAAFDDVSISTAAPVPEPQSSALIAFGLGLLLTGGSAVRYLRR